MNRAIRCPQPPAHELERVGLQLDREQSMLGISAEINRLLTAAVVNRRFCRLLLANPVGALAIGYRGDVFRLNPTEVNRISAIRATSLRDFALQLLMNEAIEERKETIYAKDRQEITLVLR